MRTLIAATALMAAASTAQALTPFDQAALEMGHCVLPAAQFGQYSSHDGGRSARAILEDKCHTEFSKFFEICKKNESDDEARRCAQIALIGAQFAITQFGK